MSYIGSALTLTVFGESHGPAIGMTLEGLPSGLALDFDALQAFLNRRAPGGALQSSRKESDRPEFLSGLRGNVSCGTPVTAIIRNEDARPGDYAAYADTPRPGHADYTAFVKYGPVGVLPGGGHFSGRLTAPLCIAGGICLQALEKLGIRVYSRIVSVGGIENLRSDALFSPEIAKAIETARAEGDSLGGVVEGAVIGLPAGLGGPLFDGLEGRLAQALFAIPAVKGVEFGSGFAGAALRGSRNNDPFFYENGKVRTRSNHAGGILGGISTGMPLCFRLAVKPTPSIAGEQETVSLSGERLASISVKGRHDPCIVPRILPCVEAAAALVLLDTVLEGRKDGIFQGR